uniref:Transmembrane protein n=1 Tax=Steinernema glaseri TaxID=37863 RepID=A0A1I7ZNY7_9BILA
MPADRASDLTRSSLALDLLLTYSSPFFLSQQGCASGEPRTGLSFHNYVHVSSISKSPHIYMLSTGDPAVTQRLRRTTAALRKVRIFAVRQQTKVRLYFHARILLPTRLFVALFIPEIGPRGAQKLLFAISGLLTAVDFAKGTSPRRIGSENRKADGNVGTWREWTRVTLRRPSAPPCSLEG